MLKGAKDTILIFQYTDEAFSPVRSNPEIEMAQLWNMITTLG